MARRAIIAAAAATTLVVAPWANADAGLEFSARPAPAGHAARPSFTYTLSSGASANDRLIVTNTSHRPEALKIFLTTGTTAANSGDAYVTGKSCNGLSCWIHGLPTAVQLPPKARKVVPFTISVPSGARRRQYLAGITLRPASAPAPAASGSHNGISTHVVIIRELTIPIAVTVGDLATLRSGLVISSVRASTTAGTILVSERNVGETFVRARGQAVCVGGHRTFAYPLSSAMVLPGDSATLTIGAPGLTRGATYRCRATLDYGGASTAAWRGFVKVPTNGPPKIVQTGPHTFSAVPKSHIPRWAIALIAAGGAVVLALLAVIVLLLRRRPRAATVEP